MTLLTSQLTASTPFPELERPEGTGNYNQKFVMEMCLIHDDLWNFVVGTDA
jgi:hypothetical protein